MINKTLVKYLFLINICNKEKGWYTLNCSKEKSASDKGIACKLFEYYYFQNKEVQVT